MPKDQTLAVRRVQPFTVAVGYEGAQENLFRLGRESAFSGRIVEEREVSFVFIRKTLECLQY